MSLSTISNRVQEIALSTDDKEYFDAIVSAEIATTLPFQLKAMRKQRGWTQKDVALRTGQNQKTISDFENPNYARFTLTSLKKLASAFDVALIVRFAPVSELVDWAATLSPENMAVPERTKDARLKRQRDGVSEDSTYAQKQPVSEVAITSSNLLTFATATSERVWTATTRNHAATAVAAFQ